ncbi:protein artemis-like [Anopheles aquasalis]|uniref:protein artemis-like n=1 Tax=Anopheles aquasalis TaxID=42839 RepID=UPI00215AE66F|nr:protein artemis-like [Anopheles aquasalis]
MSTFVGVIPELPGIAIDRFEPEQRQRASAFFLSHCHTDHMRGLELDVELPGPLYLSPVSGVFIRHRFPRHAHLVRTMAIGEQVTLTIHPVEPGGEEYELTVRSIAAEHCPGSVMFFFETTTQRVLYTGDFRPSQAHGNTSTIRSLRSQIVYLDSTFLDPDYTHFPTRIESTEKIVTLCSQWLAEDRRNRVSLWLPAHCGSEDLFLSIFERMQEKIHVTEKQRAPLLHFPALSNVLTNDATVRIHACQGTAARGRSSLACQSHGNGAEAATFVTIRPSALRWRGLKSNDEYWQATGRLFHVCYSNHASYSELAEFLQHLKPYLLEVRLSVVTDEQDLLRKTQCISSILEDPVPAEKEDIAANACLNLDRLIYKTAVDPHAVDPLSASEESTEEDEMYHRLPKRLRQEPNINR